MAVQKLMRIAIQEAKSIVSAAVAKSIGAKSEKKRSSGTKSRKKSNGGPSKHERSGLKRPERIDAEETADSHTCSNCGGSNLSEHTSSYTKIVREITKTELKNIKITVKRRYCRNCKKIVSGSTPLALPNSRYGINFMMMMVILRLHGMSHQRIREIVEIIYSTRITESAINRMVGRVARDLGPLYGKIREEVRHSPAINGDETSWARRRQELLVVDCSKQVRRILRDAPPEELKGSKKDTRQKLFGMRDI